KELEHGCSDKVGHLPLSDWTNHPQVRRGRSDRHGNCTALALLRRRADEAISDTHCILAHYLRCVRLCGRALRSTVANARTGTEHPSLYGNLELLCRRGGEGHWRR